MNPAAGHHSPPLQRPLIQLPSGYNHLSLDLPALLLYIIRIALSPAHPSIMSTSTPTNPKGHRKAHPLPAKIRGWEPLHLTFRHAKLPDLPVIHDTHIWSLLQSKNYEKSCEPSGHSIKTLAWMGDAVLYLASTKACLKAGLHSGNHKRLQVSTLYTIVRTMNVDMIEHSRWLDDKSDILISNSLIPTSRSAWVLALRRS